MNIRTIFFNMIRFCVSAIHRPPLRHRQTPLVFFAVFRYSNVFGFASIVRVLCLLFGIYGLDPSLSDILARNLLYHVEELVIA